MAPSTGKSVVANWLGAFGISGGDPVATASDVFAADAEIHICHPFNTCAGRDAMTARFLQPLIRSFRGLHRRTDILMEGAWKGYPWVSATGYLVGTFEQEFLGIAANKKLTYVRIGEFHRIDGHRIAQSYIFLDLPEWMMSVGAWPGEPSPGYVGVIPGPMTHDGILRAPQDPVEAARTLDIVETMLLRLNTPDEAWRPYWHPNMLWYGPAAFGSYLGLADFAGFQVPFEQAFEGWAGGIHPASPTKHFTRFAEGDYCCSGGWPSLSGRHVRPYLGIDATGIDVLMRVCDWWRRDGDLLVENWVFVDIPDLLRQLGQDPFPEGIG